MEDKLASEFLHGFSDARYPAEFRAKYEALECLSSGEACETLLVRDKESEELLVAKCYEQGHTLFTLTEPQELKRLSHPGLPAFREELRSDTMRCILREHVAGQTLAEKAQEGLFSEETVRDYGRQLCDILKYLHSQVPPAIHRDIKPENVVVRPDGRLTLIDLGISRLYVADARSDTVCWGSHNFAPPEQYGFLQTDCRSDIYSLGVLMAWMLSGETAPPQRPQTPLERVIAKCTAFAPERRFRDAAAVERALRELEPKVRRRHIWLLTAGTCLAVALLVGGLWLSGNLPWAQPATPQLSAAGFSEPLIEQAVRLMLGKGADEPLSSEDLAQISELYIAHATAYPDMASFYQQQDQPDHQAGPISSLRDFALLPNLRTLCLGYQQISDISPLAALTQLEHVDLQHNPIRDISPLAGLVNLQVVGLKDTRVKDISPLAECPSLQALDLCDANDYDGSDFALLGDLGALDISNDTDSYLYLAGKRIEDLKISRTTITDLSVLNEVEGLQKLEMCQTEVSDLSPLAKFSRLTYVNLCEISATDFSVLLELPQLQTVAASDAARQWLEPVVDQGGFAVEYR